MKRSDVLVPGIVAIALVIFAAFHLGTPDERNIPNSDLITYAGVQNPRLPIAKLTPGARNLAITDTNIDQTICSKTYRTGSVRDSQSSAQQKNTRYVVYQIPKPTNNTGANQTCELDHLISLELGGADTLDNIWPQCGPAGVALNQRYFKEKDLVENYLHKLVCAHEMTLTHAQDQISTDWYTVYLYMKTQPKTFGGTAIDDSDPDDL